MARHIVRSFEGVDEIRIVLAYEAIKPSFQITPCAGIGVLHENEAGTGVTQKDRDLTRYDSGIRDDARDFIRNFIRASATSGHGEFSGVHFHRLFLQEF